LQDIISVIQFVKNDGQLQNKLYACTSLDKLIISIYNPIEIWRETLHIEYDKGKELWNFKYYTVPYHKPEHERNYAGEILIEKFKKYIDTLKW
jgi:hypothetical protein